MFKIIVLALTILCSAPCYAVSIQEATKRFDTALQYILQQNNMYIVDRIYTVTKTGDVIEVVTLSYVGGNGYSQYLIGVQDVNGVPVVNTPVKVGEGFKFVVESISIDNDNVILKGKRWSDIDPHCCPSIPATLTYKYQ